MKNHNESFTTFDGTEVTTVKNPDVEPLKDILKGEMSAEMAYEEVLEKVTSDPESIRLNEFLIDHKLAVNYWKKQISDNNCEVPESSGAWGTAVKAFVKTAKVVGNNPALKALKEGEEHGLQQYEDLLKNENLTTAQKKHISETLIPCQQRHINSLSAMMNLQ